MPVPDPQPFQPHADRAARPMHFVLAGPLRSGSSLLRLLLDHHPEIACVGEFEESVSRAGDEGWPGLESYRAFLAQDGPTLLKNLEIDPAIGSYPELVRSMWDQLAGPVRKPVLGCCIHSRFDRVRDLWPDAKFIFLIRDPRDTVRSAVRMGWAGEPTSAVGLWREPAQRWLALRDRLDPEDYVEVHYERLVRDPGPELDKCCRLLGHRFDEAMLGFHAHSTYAPLNPKAAERWKREMSPRAAEIVSADCGDLLEAFGYEPSTPSPRPASGPERVRLRVANRLGRVRLRTRKYGVWLTVYWVFAKRLLPREHPWRRAGKARINAIDEAHLQ